MLPTCSAFKLILVAYIMIYSLENSLLLNLLREGSGYTAQRIHRDQYLNSLVPRATTSSKIHERTNIQKPIPGPLR